MRLTDVFIRNLKPDTKARKYADGDGLYLYITPAGTKSWRFRYRDFSGHEQELVFGKYPLKSLHDARKDKFEARQLLEKGIDPKFEKRRIEKENARILSNDLRAVAKEWFELKEGNWSTKRKQKIWNRFQNHVFPLYGRHPIAEFDELDFLQKVIRPLERKGNIDLAHCLSSQMSAVFRYARRLRKVSHNPFDGFHEMLKKGKRRNLPRITIKELPELVTALESFHGQEIVKLAIKALMLTFVRTKELRTATKGQFDFDRGIWEIPADTMKIKDRGEHIVPLSRQAISIFRQIFEMSGKSAYLFPSKSFRKHPYMNENTINSLLHTIGYKDKQCGHGFRGLASTTLHELGWFPSQVIEKQLAHEPRDRISAAYNKAEYLPLRTELMQRWADHIDDVLRDHKKRQEKYRLAPSDGNPIDAIETQST